MRPVPHCYDRPAGGVLSSTRGFTGYRVLAMRGLGAGAGSAAFALAFSRAAAELAARFATAVADISSGIFGIGSPRVSWTLDRASIPFNPRHPGANCTSARNPALLQVDGVDAPDGIDVPKWMC